MALNYNRITLNPMEEDNALTQSADPALALTQSPLVVASPLELAGDRYGMGIFTDGEKPASWDPHEQETHRATSVDTEGAAPLRTTVRSRPAPIIPIMVIEPSDPAATNWFPNGQLAYGVASWFTNNAAAFWRERVRDLVGFDYTARVQTSGVGALEGTNSGAFNVYGGGPYTMGVWLKGNSGGEVVQLRMDELGIRTTTANVTLTNTWQWYTLASVGWTTGTQAILYVVTSSTSASTWLSTGMGMVNGVVFTEYFDGSWPGCSWITTPFASPSRRPAPGGPRRDAICGDIERAVLRTQRRQAGTLRRVLPSAAATPTYAQQKQSQNPVVYWRLGETAGTVAADSSSGGNPGTYNGPVTLGAPGALSFDADRAVGLSGAGQFIQVPDATNLRLKNAFTLEAWVKPTDRLANYTIINKSNVGADRAFEFLVDITTGKLEFFSTGPGGVNSATAISTGVYSHVVVTFDGTTLLIYINGILDFSSGWSATTAANAQPFQVGRRANGDDFKGSIDEVAAHNYALTADQVRQNYLLGLNGARQPAPHQVTFDLIGASITWDDTKDLPAGLAKGVISFESQPFARGPELTTITDSFATWRMQDYGTDLGPLADFTAGGALTALAAAVTTGDHAFIHTASQYDFYSGELQMKFTPGGATISGFKGGVLHRFDSANRLECYVDDNGVNSRLRLDKVIAGVRTNLSTTNLAARIVNGTPYYVRLRLQDNVSFLEYFANQAVDPAANTTPTLTAQYSLAAGQEIDLFGILTANRAGFTFTPKNNADSADNFTIAPYLGRERTNPCLSYRAGGVPGTAPALARLTITEDSGNDQWQLIWATMQQRNGFISADNALFYEAEGRTALNGASAVAGIAGSSGSGSNVMRSAALTTNYVGVLSTQATGGGNQLTHVGDYEVFARVNVHTGAGTVRARLSWSIGDFRAWTANTAVTALGIGSDRGYQLMDLGQIHLPPGVSLPGGSGLAQWQGRVEANSTSAGDVLDVDCLYLVPVHEAAAEPHGVPIFETPSTLTSRDEFNQGAGGLNGVAAPVGGNWATAGAVTADFQIEAVGHTITRNTVSDGGNRYAIIGSSITNQFAQCDMKCSVLNGGNVTGLGVVLRYTDVNNLVYCIWQPSLPGDNRISSFKRIAGVETTLSQQVAIGALLASTFYTMRFAVDAGGRFFIWFFLQSGQPVLIATGVEAALATGGSLATGKQGAIDNNNTAGASIRNYDNFISAAATPDAAVFSTRQAEWRPNQMIRQDSAGSTWVPPSAPDGDYLRIPPRETDDQVQRVFVKGVRNDPLTALDSGIDRSVAQLSVTPRWSVISDV